MAEPVGLDPERFGELEELYRPDELAELVDTYLASAGDSIDRLQAAAAAGDLLEVREAAHRLRGGSLALGAMDLADAALEVERHSAAGEASSHDGVLRAWAATEAALEAKRPGWA